MTDPTQDPTAVLYLATWLPDELHEEFSQWCDDHHREQLAIPGFLRARRFEWIRSGRDDDPPQFLTMYDLESIETLTSPAYIEHSKASTGLPEFLRGRLRLERRNCTVVATVPSPMWPPAPTPLLDLFQLNDDRAAISLRAYIEELSIPPEIQLSLRIIDSTDDEPLVLIDHDETTTAMIDTLTAASGALRSTWRCCFDERPTS